MHEEIVRRNREREKDVRLNCVTEKAATRACIGGKSPTQALFPAWMESRLCVWVILPVPPSFSPRPKPVKDLLQLELGSELEKGLQLKRGLQPDWG